MATSTPRPTQPKCPDQAIDQLRMSIRGEVLTPEEPGYATVPVPFNAMYPGRPAIVVRAAGVADVIDAVRFAREHGLRMAIRGGGHSVAGLSSIDGGLLLELTLMNGVDVDLERGVVRVQGGARWADVDRDTQAFGLVAPGGIVSDTGVAGLTLGGGEGWVRRKYGLSCDNLVEAQVVCADGQVRTASADTNPDLFWALRGGGGNFGVVTSFTFRLSKLGPEVAFAAVFYPIDAAAQVLRGYRDFMAKAPDEVTGLAVSTTLPASEHTPPEIHDTPFIVAAGVYVGSAEKGLRTMQPLRELATPSGRHLGAAPVRRRPAGLRRVLPPRRAPQLLEVHLPERAVGRGHRPRRRRRRRRDRRSGRSSPCSRGAGQSTGWARRRPLTASGRLTGWCRSTATGKIPRRTTRLSAGCAKDGHTSTGSGRDRPT